MTQSFNNLVIEAYSGATLVMDPGGMLARAENLEFLAGYPGGLCLSASFYVERNVLDWWLLKQVNRIVFRNGQTIVYEGWIANRQNLINAANQGTTVRLIGGFGDKLMNWLIHKPWADDRLIDSQWVWLPAATASSKVFLDRNARLRFTPKAELFASGEYAAVRLTAPTGHTWKKITYNYDLQEGAQAWEIAIHNVGTSTDVVSVTASGTASSQSHTFATPTSAIELRFYARGAQTPTSDGAYYGEFSSVVAYTETSSINMEEIAKDVVGLVTDLNSSTAYIAAAASPLSLVPFITPGFASAATVLDDAIGRGDGAYNRWAFGCLTSDKAASPDGKPVLYLEQISALTDYDYAVRLDDSNLMAPLNISEDRDAVRNWIALTYTDKEGRTAYRSPDDNAALKDDTSITSYGRKALNIHLGDSTSVIADSFGQKLLAQYKDLQWRLLGPITVLGYVRGKFGKLIPACEIQPGKRIRIENYIDDLNGSGLTFLVTGTHYDDESETCAITTGRLDEVMLPRFAHERSQGGPVHPADGSGGAGAGGDEGMKRHIWELIGWSRRQFLDAKAAGTWPAVKRAAIRARLETGSYKNWRRFL